MFHHQPRLPIDSELLPMSDAGEPDIDFFIENMVNVRDEFKDNGSANIIKAQQHQKEYYDTPPRYTGVTTSGNKSMSLFMQELQLWHESLGRKHISKGKKGWKLEDKYKGPYVIHKSLGKGFYELINADGKILKSKHNMVCM